MKRYNVVMGTRGPKEYASGARSEARQRFLDYLRIRTSRVLQDIVDSDLRASNGHDSPRLHDLRIRRAHRGPQILESDLKSSNQCASPLRRQMRREKIRRDRYRRYFADENLKSSNLDLKIRRAHARQKLVDIDLRRDGLRGAGG